MNNLISNEEIKQFNENGAVFLKGRFDIEWIEKLKKGVINEPRFFQTN